MRKTTIAFLIITATCFFALVGCRKNQRGGRSKVNGIVAHHGKAIPEATVYVKFNAKEFPGNNLAAYNYTVTSNSAGFYEVDELCKGDYYLYVLGKDPAIAPPYDVKGGLAFSIKSSETLSLDLPVGEE